MQRLSRALDTIWITSAFDPRKPVSPDWAEREPAPILRSGDEEGVFEDAPWEHHQGDDAMQWSPEGHGAAEPDLDFDGGGLGSHELRTPELPIMTASDMAALNAHWMTMRNMGGKLDGSEGHYVEYHPTSSVNHYYTYNPRHSQDWAPWNLVSTHWLLREPIQSRHQTFSEAVDQGTKNRSIIDRQVG